MSGLRRGLAVACAFELAVVPKLPGPPAGTPLRSGKRSKSKSSFANYLCVA